MICKDYDIKPCTHCGRMGKPYFCYMNHLDLKIRTTEDLKGFILFSLQHPVVTLAGVGPGFYYINHLRLVIKTVKPEYLDMFDKLSVLS